MVGEFIKLHNSEWIEKQRVAGKCAAQALQLLSSYVQNGTDLTLIQLNKLAEEFILDQGHQLTFKGYKGFPNGVCISVNKELVHGIAKDERLESNDIVKFDLGVSYDGVIADTATTCIFGEPKNKIHKLLVSECKKALLESISKISIGKRLGVIGNCIYKIGRNNNFGVITDYGGHSLDYNKPHANPFINNKSYPSEGIHFQSGMTLAIEPMFVIGSTITKVLDDGWTVVTSDVNVHEEHTIFIHEDRVEIMTELH